MATRGENVSERKHHEPDRLPEHYWDTNANRGSLRAQYADCQPRFFGERDWLAQNQPCRDRYPDVVVLVNMNRANQGRQQTDRKNHIP